MADVLLVEDNHDLAEALCRALNRVGITTIFVSNLRTAYQELEKRTVEVVVLDRVLKQDNGLELLEYLQDAHAHVRTLIISGLGLWNDRVEGLEQGADDYLTKPFSQDEFKLRVQRLLRVEKTSKESCYELGAVKLGPDVGRLTVADRSQLLRRREYEILSCLVRYKDTIVSRDKLISLVWRGEVPTYNTIDTYVRRIRQHLGPYAHYIQTHRGLGYLAKEAP